MDIIIESSNVLKEGEEIRVIEEVLDVESSLYLNSDQIESEITNLLFKTYGQQKKQQILSRKTKLFMNVFFRQKDLIKTLDTMKPIIKVKKIISYDGLNPKNNYCPDPVYDDAHFGIGEELETFLTNYKALNTDRINKYYQTVKNLYNLQKGFIPIASKTSVLMKEDTDAFRHSVLENEICMQYIHKKKKDDKPVNYINYSYETIHIIKNVVNDELEVYNGDSVDIKGYYNVTNLQNVTTHKTFNIKDYLDDLNKLEVKASVVIQFNDFAFINKKQIDSIDGVIIHKTSRMLEIQLYKEIKYHGCDTKVLYYYINKTVNPFYVYPHNAQFMYNKSLLKTDNIAFALYKSYKFTLAFISPRTINELIYVHKNDLRDIYNLNDLSNIIGYKLDRIDNEDLISILNLKRLKKENYKFNDYNIPAYIDRINILRHIPHYIHEKTYIDTYLNRTIALNNSNDYGRNHLLKMNKLSLLALHKVLKKNREYFIKKIEKNNEIFETADNIKSIKVEKIAKVAKIYNNIEDLEADNDKEITFDKKYDKTLYKLKDDVRKNISTKELKAYLIKRLTEIGGYIDIEFEVESIIAGTRIVRPGDYAILYFDNKECITEKIHQINYVRQVVGKGEIWVKAVVAPFPVCENKLINYENLEKSLILDPFDEICRKNKQIKERIKYNNAVDSARYLENIINFIDNFDINEIDYELYYYKHQNYILYESRHLKRSLVRKYVEKIDYSEFMGEDDINVDKVYGETLEYGENRGFMQPLAKPDPEKQTNSDILDTLLHISDIPFESVHSKYILDFVNLKVPSSLMSDKIKNEMARLDKQKKLYIAKYGTLGEEQRKKFEDVATKKLKEVDVTATTEYYTDVILTITAMLCLLLMAQYPYLLLRQIHPRCMQFFSYAGYPLIEDVPKSLTKYFACIIISLATPNDIKFGVFNEKNVIDIEKRLNKVIDDILDVKYDLKTQVLSNKKNILKKTIIPKDDSKYLQLNIFYRPCFEYPANATGILEYLKIMNDIVKKSPILKLNVFNNPTIINSCCMEQLNSEIMYYDYFINIHTTFKKYYKKLLDYERKLIKTSMYIPSSKKVEYIDLFLYKNIGFPEDRSLLVSTEPEIDMKTGITKFTEDLYAELIILYEYVIDILQSKLDTINTPILDHVKNIIIDITTYSSIENIRAYFVLFINTKLKTILAKIINQYKYTDHQIAHKIGGTPEFLKIMESIYTFYDYVPILDNLKSLVKKYFIDKVSNNMYDTEKNSILNMSLNFFNFLKEFLDISEDNLILKQSCEIVNYLLNVLVEYFFTNDVNSSQIKHSMETLREGAKQTMMDSYSKDEEYRQLQIQLKKMGDKNVLKMDEEEKDIRNIVEQDFDEDIAKHHQQEEINENLNYQGYPGENAEGDVDYDEYYAAPEQEDNYGY